METLTVLPREGIGRLRLGMTPDEIETALCTMQAEWAELDNSKLDVTLQNEIESPGWLTGRYISSTAFFRVEYYRGRAVEIGVDSLIRERGNISLYGIDIFRTPAEEVIEALKTFSSCTCEIADKELATDCWFAEIGVRLWRERAFHPKLLQNKEYMEEMQLVLEDEYPYRYFQLVAVQSEDYQEAYSTIDGLDDLERYRV